MQTNKRPLQLPNSNVNSKKKPKPNESTQSNTLYKYFESNKKPPTPPPKQTSLFSFFKRESTNTDNDANDVIETKPHETVEKKNPLSNAFAKLMNPVKIESQTKIEERDDNSSEATGANEPSSFNNKTARKCPFYKRIEGSFYF